MTEGFAPSQVRYGQEPAILQLKGVGSTLMPEQYSAEAFAGAEHKAAGHLVQSLDFTEKTCCDPTRPQKCLGPSGGHPDLLGILSGPC